MNKNLFVLGAGNMAESIVAALLEDKVFEPYNVTVYDISEARMDHMIETYGVIAAPKHIAFNDSEANRTGVAMFMTEQKAREGELRAEQACFEDAGALGAMTAYNRVGIYTSNAHPTMLKNIVRGEWGFKGLMSEDFIMDASYVTLKEAVINGVTMSCNTGENTMEAVSNK